jgi:type I restriction enzyme S subunit
MSNRKPIPAGWYYTNLCNVCKKITDGTHDTPIRKETGIPYITANHIKEGAIDFENCYYLSEEDHNLIYRRCNPEKGDVLIVNIGAGTANPARVQVDFEFGMKNVALLKPDKSKLSGYYLEQYQIYNRPRLFHQLKSGGAQPFLSLNQLSKLLILIPPLHEQKAIANLLSTWDEAIDKIERLIQAKENIFQFYIQQLINKRLCKWQHSKSKSLFDIISEKNHDSEELLSVTQFRGVIPRNMLEGRVMSPTGTKSNYKLINPGDFVISLRSFQGGIEFSNYRGIISPAYTVLRPKVNINTEFYRHFFKTMIFIKKYLNLSVGRIF